MDRSSLHASLRMRRSAGTIASLAEADSNWAWEMGKRGWQGQKAGEYTDVMIVNESEDKHEKWGGKV